MKREGGLLFTFANSGLVLNAMSANFIEKILQDKSLDGEIFFCYGDVRRIKQEQTFGLVHAGFWEEKDTEWLGNLNFKAILCANSCRIADTAAIKPNLNKFSYHHFVSSYVRHMMIKAQTG